MRLLLFTGKGGVGKTTAAAGTAVLAAGHGLRSLVVSTDAAHSLADAMEVPVRGGSPVEVDRNLFVQQVDTQQRLERSWEEISTYLHSVFVTAGLDPVTADELTVLPGAEEILALLEVHDQARSGRWDLVVVDCAPTAETLRLLALPEALGWYMQRVLPVERRVVKAFRPLLTRSAGVPMPDDGVFDAVARLHRDLDRVHDLLTGADATVRLVLTPESVVVAEARRSLTSLSLYGYRVDGVIANRVFPAGGADQWRLQWAAAQTEILAQVRSSFDPLPTWCSTYRACEPIGLAELAAFGAELYGASDPCAVPARGAPVRVERDGQRVLVRVTLPFVERGEVDLARRGDDLVVTVGARRRILALPTGLRATRVTDARLHDGALEVTFEPQHPREG